MLRIKTLIYVVFVMGMLLGTCNATAQAAVVFNDLSEQLLFNSVTGNRVFDEPFQVVNSTGRTWTDFHFRLVVSNLLGPGMDGAGDAVFAQNGIDPFFDSLHSFLGFDGVAYEGPGTTRFTSSSGGTFPVQPDLLDVRNLSIPDDTTYEFTLDVFTGELAQLQGWKLFGNPTVELTLRGLLQNDALPPIQVLENPRRFRFQFDVGDGYGTNDDTVWIDPVVAIGYDYLVESGPNFASVTMPLGLGDSGFDLFVFDGSNFVFQTTVAEGATFDFASVNPAGLDRFRILDIDPNLGLDPNDPLAFPTGLTFISAGSAQFSMTPIATPEPASLLLFVVGSISLLSIGRPRRMRRVAGRSVTLDKTERKV